MKLHQQEQLHLHCQQPILQPPGYHTLSTQWKGPGLFGLLLTCSDVEAGLTLASKASSTQGSITGQSSEEICKLVYISCCLALNTMLLCCQAI